MREDEIIQWTGLRAAKQDKDRRKTGGTNRNRVVNNMCPINSFLKNNMLQIHSYSKWANAPMLTKIDRFVFKTTICCLE